MKENDLTLKKTISRWDLIEHIMDVDYKDDLVLLTNTPAQAKCLPHSLEQAARGIDFAMNSDKT